MRKIKVFSTLQSGIRELDVQATTWGELKTALAEKGIMTNDMEAIVKENSTSFMSDSAPLPENLGKSTSGETTHDFTLYLAPTKTKSGK